MNEAGFWNGVRGALHQPPRSIARKLTDAFTAGTPDAFYVIDRVVGFLELKYTPAWPARASTPVRVGAGLTVEQRRYLEMLRAAGAQAHVLLGVAGDWFLLTADQVPLDGRIAPWKLTAPDVPHGPRARMVVELRAALLAALEPGA